MSEKLTKGWAYIGNAKRIHFVSGGRSLCGGWMYLGDVFYPDEDRDRFSIPACKACARKRDAVLDAAAKKEANS